MRSFASACLLAASVSAVSLSSNRHPWAIDEVEEMLNNGGLVPLESVKDKLVVLDGAKKDDDADEEDAPSVKSGVMQQVLDGFGKILGDNDVIENLATGLIQDAQNLEIDEIISSANSAAQVALKVADPDTAGSLVQQIFEEEKLQIQTSNKKHDAKIADIAKESVVSQISNEAVKNNLLNDIAHAPEDPVEIAHIVADANLPFPVDTGVAVIKDGAVVEDEEVADEKTADVASDANDMKENPMFENFLKHLMFDFDSLKASPERPSAPGFDADEDLIARPERPEKPGFDVDEDLIARPERAQAFNTDLGKSLLDVPEKPAAPGFDVDEDLIADPEAPDAPDSDVDEIMEDPGKQGAPEGLLDFERLGNHFDLDRDIDLMDGSIRKMDLDLPEFNFVRPGRPDAVGRPDMGRLDTDRPDTSYGDFVRPGRPGAPGRPDMGRLDTDRPDTSRGDFERPGRPGKPGRPDMGRLDTDRPDTSYGDFERPGKPDALDFSGMKVDPIVPRGAPEREAHVLHVPEREERPARKARTPHVPSDRTRPEREEREAYVPSDRTRKPRTPHVPSDRTRPERPEREAYVPSDRTRPERPERPAREAYVPEKRTKPERKTVKIAHPMRREIIDDDMLVQHGQAFW